MQNKSKKIIDLSKSNHKDLYELSKAIMEVANTLQGLGLKLKIKKTSQTRTQNRLLDKS